MKIQNGVVRSIVVPAEHGDRGWVKFENCLDSFYCKKIKMINGDAGEKGSNIREQSQNLVK